MYIDVYVLCLIDLLIFSYIILSCITYSNMKYLPIHELNEF